MREPSRPGDLAVTPLGRPVRIVRLCAGGYRECVYLDAEDDADGSGRVQLLDKLLRIVSRARPRDDVLEEVANVTISRARKRAERNPPTPRAKRRA